MEEERRITRFWCFSGNRGVVQHAQRCLAVFCQTRAFRDRLHVNSTLGIGAVPMLDELGPVQLDAQGKVAFALPAHNQPFCYDWSVFIGKPHMIDPDTVGKVVLISNVRWHEAFEQLKFRAKGAQIVGYMAASTLLFYFLGLPASIPADYVYDEADSGALVKDDVWYTWLTHKVGVTWNGQMAEVPLYRWLSSSNISEQIRPNKEIGQLYRNALLAEFTTLKPLAEGAHSYIPLAIEHHEVEFTEPEDLVLADSPCQSEGHVRCDRRRSTS